jgi:DNA polymerase IV
VLSYSTVTQKMSDDRLKAKEAYFEQEKLLDITDDENGFPDEGYENVERAVLPPPGLIRKTSSFLGPTPKERQAQLEARSSIYHKVVKPDSITLRRSNTALEMGPATSPPSKTSPPRPMSSPDYRSKAKLDKGKGITDRPTRASKPFYTDLGVAPRELKHGKNVKPADNIRLDPEDKQLLKGMIVYFYPNDDISMARRRRIHKIIHLGAAWVKTWRDDVTHVMVDDSNHTYMQVLRNVNMTALPVCIVSETKGQNSADLCSATWS